MDTQIKYLAARVDELIEVCKRLRAQNDTLKASHDKIAAEKSHWLQQNREVRQHLEELLRQLRTEKIK